MSLYLKYNGTRFPRAVILSKHRKEVFHPSRRVISFENNDAYMILKFNRRLNPNLWEFDVVDKLPEAKVAIMPFATTPPKPLKESVTEELKPKKTKTAMKPMRGKKRR